MLVLRAVVFGLAGGCLVLLLRWPSTLRIERQYVAVAAPHVPSVMPTIIDVAPGLSSTQIAQLVRLAPDERVTAVDDHPVTGNLDAGAAIAQPTSRGYLDLTVSRAGTVGHERRVLVLVH